MEFTRAKFSSANSLIPMKILTSHLGGLEASNSELVSVSSLTSKPNLQQWGGG